MLARVCAAMGCGLVLAAAAGAAEEVHERLAPERVPKPVLEAATRAGGTGTVIAATKLTEVEEKTVTTCYELLVKRADGAHVRVEVVSDDRAGIRGAWSERMLAPAELPDDVKGVLDKLCPGGQVVAAHQHVEYEDRETHTGYAVFVKRKNGPVLEVEVGMTEAGVVGEAHIEEPLAPADVPQAVLTAARAMRPGSALLVAAKHTVFDDGHLGTEYTFRMKQKTGAVFSVRVGLKADGTIRGVRVRDKDDDDDEDDDNDNDEDDDDEDDGGDEDDDDG